MIFAAILAGGVGSRMKRGGLPKQFLSLGDEPIIVRSLRKFVACKRVDEIYIGTHGEYLDYMQKLIEEYIPEATERIHIVAGGKDRNDTIFNVISAIESAHGDVSDSVIVTHDAVRPFVNERIIEENIDAALAYGAVDTVVPAIDTIVKSNDGQEIAEIPERQYLYQGQTPQSFRIDLLKEMYASLSDDEKLILTDACKICVMRGAPVRLVAGDVINMKITTPGDYEIARAIVNKDLQAE